MASITKRRNSTTLDEAGLKYSLVRGKDETSSDFLSRVIKANSNLEQSRYKLERSLEYATPIQGFELFKITKTNPEENVEISVNETRITITVDAVLVYRKKLEEIKFLKNLKEDLDLITNISVEVIKEGNWEYLSAKNIVQNNSVKTRLNYSLKGVTQELPDENIEYVQDHLGLFVEKVEDESFTLTNGHYHLEEDNTLHKYSPRLESVFYKYEDFPFYITWSPIRSYKVNAEEFDDILKDRIKNSEAFGLIDENTEVDNIETVEVLSQRGAKIVNKILEKHNTYWGK